MTKVFCYGVFLLCSVFFQQGFGINNSSSANFSTSLFASSSASPLQIAATTSAASSASPSATITTGAGGGSATATLSAGGVSATATSSAGGGSVSPTAGAATASPASSASQAGSIAPSPTTQTAVASSSQNVGWGAWTASSPCKKFAKGNGTRYRSRVCIGGSCTGPTNETQYCKPTVRNVNVSMTLTDKVYVAALANINSPESQELATTIVNALHSVFKDIPSYENSTVTEFVKGSVIAKVVMTFGPSTSSSPKDPGTVLKQAVASGDLGGLKVDPESITIKESVEGATLTIWVTDKSLCKTLCCGGAGGGLVWQNRTCTVTSGSCEGVLLSKETQCEADCLDECPSAGARVVLSSLLVAMTAMLYLFMAT